MAVLHYGNADIELTADEVRSLTASDSPIYEPGLISLNLTNGGWIHLVVGPGIPDLDRRPRRRGTSGLRDVGVPLRLRR